MLRRRLALDLLAPTVLVSLVLVAACALAALYLNHLNINVSKGLAENVQSTQVAARLETTVKELTRLLRNETHLPDFMEKIHEQNQLVRGVLVEADVLANLENERALVEQVRDGLKDYLSRWDERSASGSGGSPGRSTNADLARFLEERVLADCMRLRRFNTDQIAESERLNRDIVLKVTWGLIAVGIGAPLAGLLLGYGVARSLRRSIYQLSVRIRDAAGRLNRELGPVTLDDESDLPTLHRHMQSVLEEIERVVDQLQQREREVLRSEQLAAVGQVAAGVAHELRNPMTSIKMLVQTALEGNPPLGLPTEDLSIIEREVRRMEQCIRLFLDFARPPRSERRASDLLEVVRRTLTLVEGRARKQRVSLEADLPPAPVIVNIDAEQVHQVLVNLLLNSLDALPHGGVVRVQVSPRADRIAGSPAVELRVQDNGSGIAPHIQHRLFEPFVSNKDTGLGLGLSICKRLVEGHGGTIHGENLPEGGAVFSFTLAE